MRPEPNIHIQRFRLSNPPSPCGKNYGAFLIGSLRIISSGTPEPEDPIQWEHVSVSHPGRIPTWAEMCQVKELFWGDDEVVMQLHPAKRDYVNIHAHCLHLWKPVGVPIPLPPKIAV